MSLAEDINEIIVEWANHEFMETAQSMSLAEKIAERLNKVYVFYDLLYDYTSGMAVATAPNLEEAIKVLNGNSTFSIHNDKLLKNNVSESELLKSKVVEISINNKSGFWLLGGS